MFFIKVVGLSLTFPEPLRNHDLDICSSRYGQVSAQRSVLGRNTISGFLQNLRLLEIELGFGFNMKVVELFIIFPSLKNQPNPTSRAPDMTKNLK